MSKEYVRQLVTNKLAQFPVLTNERKSYPNRPDNKPPKLGQWLRLHDIEFVLNKIASIGSEPCKRRTGVIVIDVFEHLDGGTKNITELTDKLEDYFGLWSETDFWTDPANTVNDPNSGDKNGYYKSTVYVPFTYDEG